MKIRIETDTDRYECDDCGMCFAEGGKVFVDDVLILEKPASAHCYGGSSHSESDLLVMALTKLGHEIIVDDERYHITCHDEDYHGPLEG